MHRRTKAALIGTAVYLIFIFSLVVYRFAEFICLELNALGDFLAGVFGPLALGWVVVGYFQQGDELKQSTAALRLQGEELKNSVEQQHKLAEISRQALEHEKEVRQNEVHRRARSLRPVLSLKGGSPMMENGEYVLDCELINHGSQVYDIQVILRVGNTKSLVGCASVMNDGDTIRFSVNWDPRRSGGKLDVEILYENRDGVHAATTFTAISSGNFGALDFIKVASLNE